MPVYETTLELSTRGDCDIVDLTDRIAEVVRRAGVQAGAAAVFVRGSTAAVTLMEYEPGGVSDLKQTLERLVPRAGDYEHNRLNHDTNSHAHIRAALVGPSETIPISAGRLATGTWQQVVLIDFDDRPRERTVTVELIT